MIITAVATRLRVCIREIVVASSRREKQRWSASRLAEERNNSLHVREWNTRMRADGLILVPNELRIRYGDSTWYALYFKLHLKRYADAQVKERERERDHLAQNSHARLPRALQLFRFYIRLTVMTQSARA